MAHRVLFVDDEPHIVDGLKRALRKEPYQIITANSGHEALTIIQQEPVDVVVSDEMMPGMSGSELLAFVCRDYPETIRMILTGHASLDMAIKAINEGEIYRFFTKPCSELDLAVTIRHALRQKDLVEENRKRSEELAVANKELESFNYTVSHDLRSPLQSIDGFSHALIEDYYQSLDEQGREYLHFIQAASKRMMQLIEDLMNLSRCSRDVIKYDTINLSSIFKEVSQSFQAGNPERAVALISPEKVISYGDERLLRVVFENMVGNSWKFTEKHATATIEFGVIEGESADGAVDGPVYFIRDDGAGFDMAYADKLFGAFQRLHSLNEFEGTGIGLATVQRIIQRHGGVIWAEGVIEKGATFYFTLNAVKEEVNHE